KKLETDNQVKKAFDEPLTSSEGLSLALNTNLMNGESMDGGDVEENGKEGKEEEEGKELEAEKVEGAREDGEEKVIPYSEDLVEESQELDMGRPAAGEGGEAAARKDIEDGESEAEEEEAEEEEEEGGEAEEEEEEEEKEEEDQQETSGVRNSMPPPLPASMEAEEKTPMESGAYQALPADKQAEKKDYSRLVLAAIVIVLLGAAVGYGVIKWGEKSGGKEAQVAEGTQQGKTGKGAEDGKAATESPDAEKLKAVREEEKKAGEPGSHILSAEVTASSYHKKYPPEHVADGDPATVWQEEKTRKPEGEWLRFDFNHEVTLTKLGIVSGFDYIDDDGKDYYPLNCRLQEADLIFSNGENIKVNLEDKRSIQFVEADPPIKTMWVRLTVYSTYRGSWFNDNSIGEIEAWGYEEEGEEEAVGEEETVGEEEGGEEEGAEEAEEGAGKEEGEGEGGTDEEKEGESGGGTGGDEEEDRDPGE
ncbi:MAG: discoidin domain-containing protein, partial [Pseudomonadota bacterium]